MSLADTPVGFGLTSVSQMRSIRDKVSNYFRSFQTSVRRLLILRNCLSFCARASQREPCCRSDSITTLGPLFRGGAERMDNAVVSGSETIAHASRAQTDARDLASLGYKQEFQRDFGGFSNFALSFSVISILTGAITLYDYGLSMGGPRQMTLGWPLATVGTLLIALSMAELCSAFPTSGGMIHWSATLGGPTWAWFTAWLNIVGLVTVIAGT